MLIVRALQSSVGKKLVMALTGIGLFAFVLQHMAGHLIMFAGADAYNEYAATMQALAAKWPVRITLLVGVLLHLWASAALTARNRRARPATYARNRNFGASLASRTMLVSGAFLAVFIVYHLLHFTLGVTDPVDFQLVDRFGRHDVYTGMVRAFTQPALLAFYLTAMALLCVHLSHGIASFFRSLGLMNGRWRKLEERFAIFGAFVVFTGFASVPVAIAIGVIS